MTSLTEEELGHDPLELATDYNWSVVNVSGNLPLDVCRSVIENYRAKHMVAKYSGLNYRVGGYLLCPMCSTPWIAGDVRPRLMSVTSNIAMKKILKKERKKPSKLTKMEKIIISAFRKKSNIIEVKCTRCNHKMREICANPEKEKKDKQKIEKSISTPIEKKKKKKRNTKELNAGLSLSSMTSSSLNSSKRSSKGGSISSTSDSFVLDTSLSESVFLPDESMNISRETEKSNFSGNNSREELSSVSSLSDQQLLAQRLSESITSSPQHNSNPNSRPGSRPGSKPNSRPGSKPSSRPGSRPVSPVAKKKEKQRKLAGLKNAMLKGNIENSDKQKNNSLDNFLKTLF